MRLAKILLPVDFSEHTAGAAHYARALACRFHSDLTIAHVFQAQNLMFTGEAAMPATWYEDMRNESQRRLQECYVDEFENIPVRRLLLDGDPARSIVDLARHDDTDLIVVPTHGYGGFRRFLLGSVTAKLLDDVDCPVLTGVHIQAPPALEPIFFRHILRAVDFDAAGEKALRWAAGFAADFHSCLTVVHALPPIEVGQAHYFD